MKNLFDWPDGAFLFGVIIAILFAIIIIAQEILLHV